MFFDFIFVLMKSLIKITDVLSVNRIDDAIASQQLQAHNIHDS